MRYFQNFPKIKYQTTEIVDGFPQAMERIVPNMTVRFKPIYENFSYTWYVVQDRDRPDTLAAQWYRSSQYTWVLLLSNEMRDLYDWPMSSSEFADYMNKKYESVAGVKDGVTVAHNTIHEYRWINAVTGQRLVVDATFYNTLAPTQREQISVYEYESSLNDNRRNIKRLTSESFEKFVQEFQNKVATESIQ